jgi:hypothetical protein
MPNGIYPVPVFRPYFGTSQGARPTLGLRLTTRWHRDRLDEQLARGADPGDSPELNLRSRQLESRAVRLELADTVGFVVREAHMHQAAPPARLSLRRAEVRRCLNDLLALAERLRDDRPVDVRGVAMTRLLLTDGASALYDVAAPLSLQHTVRSARLALDPPDAGQAALAAAA